MSCARAATEQVVRTAEGSLAAPWQQALTSSHLFERLGSLRVGIELSTAEGLGRVE